MRSRRRVHRTRLALTLARVRRSTLFTLSAALSAALLAGATTSDLLQDAAAAEERWTDVVDVDVVVRPVAALTAVPASAVERRAVPRHLMPEGATADGVGRVTLAPLVPGDVLVDARLSTGVVPAGWRAIGLPAPGTGAHPDVGTGDPVEVLDAVSMDAPVIATGQVVAVRDTDGMVTVAVPADVAGAVAYAALSGTAVLSLIAVPPR